MGLATFTLVVGLAATVTVRPGDNLNEWIRRMPPGTTLLVSAGVYSGPVVVDRPIRLIGQPGAIIDGRGRGTVVRIRSSDVILRGFLIRNSGDGLTREDAGVLVEDARNVQIVGNRLEHTLFGIYLKNVHHSHIVGNTVIGKPYELPRRGDGIRLWGSHDNLIAENRVIGARDMIVWYSRRTRFLRNTVERGRYGLHYMYSDASEVRENDFHHNATGVVVMYSTDVRIEANAIHHHTGPSAYGILLKDSDELVIRRNRIYANRVGIYWDNSPYRFDRWNWIEGNLILGNGVGLTFLPSVQRNHIVGNVLVENLQSIEVTGGGTLQGNRWSHGGRGNFWDDYEGYDLDGDGVGEIPYRATRLFDRLTDRYPAARLFFGSPVVWVLDWVGRVFPTFQPRPRIHDPHPLIRLPSWVRDMLPRRRGAWKMWVGISSGMVLVGWTLLFTMALTVTGVRRRTRHA